MDEERIHLLVWGTSMETRYFHFLSSTSFFPLADLIPEYVTGTIHLLTRPKRLADSSGSLNTAAALRQHFSLVQPRL